MSFTVKRGANQGKGRLTQGWEMRENARKGALVSSKGHKEKEPKGTAVIQIELKRGTANIASGPSRILRENEEVKSFCSPPASERREGGKAWSAWLSIKERDINRAQHLQGKEEGGQSPCLSKGGEAAALTAGRPKKEKKGGADDQKKTVPDSGGTPSPTKSSKRPGSVWGVTSS